MKDVDHIDEQMPTTSFRMKRRKTFGSKKRFFDFSITILTFLATNKERSVNFNVICKELPNMNKNNIPTSLNDRPLISYVLKKLTSNNILILEKQRQKRLYQLSPLGIEIQSFYSKMTEFYDQYAVFNKMIKEKVLFIESGLISLIDNYDRLSLDEHEELKLRIIKNINKLKDLGWKSTEIKFYNFIRTNTIELKLLFDYTMIPLLVIAYSEVLRRNTDIRKDFVLPFLNHLIEKIIFKRIDTMIKNYEEEMYGLTMIKRIPPSNEPIVIQNTVGLPYLFFLNLINMFTEKILLSNMTSEVEGLVLCYLRLLNAPLVNYSIEIQSLFLYISEYKEKLADKKNNRQTALSYYELSIGTMVCLQNALKKFADERKFIITESGITTS